jgi:cytidylate kinase
MSIITISRQMGSRGDEIALAVTKQLGAQQVCRDIINQAARAARVPQVALADIDELGVLGLHPSAEEWRSYKNQVERIIIDLVKEGNKVIVGRGGQMVLHDWPKVLHVRIITPLDIRIARLQQSKHISLDAVRARLEASDKTRARYLRKNYGVDWNDPALYHLVINTGVVKLDQAVQVILQAL